MTLTHFYPLSGRMVTKYRVHSRCVDVTMLDILTPIDVPLIVQSFFALDGAISYDGHTEPLLVVQVTELLDGIFVGCTFNHVIGNGTSYWKFFNAFAEITRKLRKASKEAGDQHIECNISHLPISKSWLMEGDGDLINLPFSHHKEFIEDQYERLLLRERMFHFTEESLEKLEAKANEECNTKHCQISSFQALSALVWRSITRACHFTSDRKTSCRLAINDRAWYWMGGVAFARGYKEHTDEKIRGLGEEWMKKPRKYQMRSSLRFDVYGCDFGLGTAVAARCGYANKFDKKVTSYRGLTGIGSVMLEVCLPPESMSALESDEEFMDAVSPYEIHLQHLSFSPRLQDD
ncbi:hypothetical protein MKX01_006139 [Papaver californicum]|nr:hypothetical protein MKX01_006139 [Papaver californicum]